jgi:hypothetical protein
MTMIAAVFRFAIGEVVRLLLHLEAVPGSGAFF